MDSNSRAYGIIQDIAKKFLGFETIEARHSDQLDFKEVSVWQVHKALEEAFDSGFRMCMEYHDR